MDNMRIQNIQEIADSIIDVLHVVDSRESDPDSREYMADCVMALLSAAGTIIEYIESATEKPDHRRQETAEMIRKYMSEVFSD